MGLFSSKEKTTVGTVFTRAIKDDDIPNAAKTGLIRAIFQNGNIGDYVLEEMSNSIGTRAEKFYDYARKSYTYGLPSGERMSATQGKDQVQQVIDVMEGTTCFIEYCQYGPPNALHIAWMKLIRDYGYNPETNELPVLSAQKGTQVYLNDMAVVIRASVLPGINSNVLDQWGTSPRAGYTPVRKSATKRSASLIKFGPVYSSPTATTDYVQANACWQVTEAVQYGEDTKQELVMKYQDLVIGFLDYDSTKDYFHVKYTVNGVTKYWIYQVGSGVYPILDNVYNQPAPVIGSYFPFVYFRFNKTSEISDKSTEAYKTSKKLMKKLGMSYDQIAEAIDKNPDIKDVEQAMMMFAVPAHSTKPLDQRYLFDFFDTQFYAAEDRYTSAIEGAIRAEFGTNSDENTYTTVIQDRRFRMALTYQGIFKQRVVGDIGPIGTYTNGFTSETTSQTYYDTISMQPFPVQDVSKYHYYRKQVSAFMYEEIQITNLKTIFFVYGAYTTIGDETDDILMIPLDRGIIENYSAKDKEILYTTSMYYVFNSRVITKIKWYQTGLFQAIVIIVSLVVLIASYGSTWQEFAAAVAAGATAESIIITIAMGIIKAIAISYAVKLFVKEVGLEAAFVIAIVAAAAGYYQYITSNASTVAGAPWAKELLDLSSSLAKGVNANVKEGIANLLGEYEEMKLLASENEKLLDNANKLLESNNLLSPMVIFGESPTDYYDRTVHSGNIGIIGLDAIRSYVDASLRLPKLSDTIVSGEDLGNF